MRLTEFDIYKDLLKEKSGLVITPDKTYLLDSRLMPVAQKWGYDNLSMMTAALQGVPDTALVNDIVEAMTTNETSFFRDAHPFNCFKDHVLPYMIKNRIYDRRFKVWSAAASSGQEPYSLAMLIKDLGDQIKGWNIDILATDISQQILDQAKNGVYSQFEVQRGLPVQLMLKYFKQDGDKWHISDEIKKMINYRIFNLLHPMGEIGKPDIIFCRNVLIYFDEETKRGILENMNNILKEDGFLFLGGAETVLGITDKFKPVPGLRGLYAKKDSAHLQKAA